MKNRILFIFISLAMVLALSIGLVGCTTTLPPEEGGDYTVLIGGSFPLTVAYPEDGEAVLDAFVDYAKWVNDNHKISPWGPAFSGNVTLNITLEVVQMDDQGINAGLAQSNYATLKAQGLLMFRISGSPIATAMKEQLYGDSCGATSQASGAYLMTPTRTIFMNYPIYTDQAAAIADWFWDNWEGEEDPKVGYITNNTFGNVGSLIIPQLNTYLTTKGYVVDTNYQILAASGVIDASAALTYAVNNEWDLSLGAMTTYTSGQLMEQADALGIGTTGSNYTMQFGLCSPSHAAVFVRNYDDRGDGLVVAGSYPGWDDAGLGVAFCKTLQDTYRGGFDPEAYALSHIMYQHGVVEAMIQVEAIRLALLNTGKNPDQLTMADVLNYGFLKIKDLDTGGIIPTKITYGIGDVEGAGSVRVDQCVDGAVVNLGTNFVLHHIYQP